MQVRKYAIDLLVTQRSHMMVKEEMTEGVEIMTEGVEIMTEGVEIMTEGAEIMAEGAEIIRLLIPM